VRHSAISDHRIAIVSNHRCDGADNDNKGHKYPTNGVDLRYALRITRLVQVCHRDLPRYKGGRLQQRGRYRPGAPEMRTGDK
jgi:hypothetical protein